MCIPALYSKCAETVSELLMWSMPWNANVPPHLLLTGKVKFTFWPCFKLAIVTIIHDICTLKLHITTKNSLNDRAMLIWSLNNGFCNGQRLTNSGLNRIWRQRGSCTIERKLSARKQALSLLTSSVRDSTANCSPALLLALFACDVSAAFSRLTAATSAVIFRDWWKAVTTT